MNQESNTADYTEQEHHRISLCMSAAQIQHPPGSKTMPLAITCIESLKRKHVDTPEKRTAFMKIIDTSNKAAADGFMKRLGMTTTAGLQASPVSETYEELCVEWLVALRDVLGRDLEAEVVTDEQPLSIPDAFPDECRYPEEPFPRIAFMSPEAALYMKLQEIETTIPARGNGDKRPIAPKDCFKWEYSLSDRIEAYLHDRVSFEWDTETRRLVPTAHSTLTSNCRRARAAQRFAKDMRSIDSFGGHRNKGKPSNLLLSLIGRAKKK